MAAAPGGVGTNDELLRAVRDAAAGEYEILGEMGRGPSGGVIYLARELATARLVALRLEPDDDGYTLTVVRQLDASIPAMGSTCPRCGGALTGWGRFCAQCGTDVGAAPGETRSREELLDAVRSAAQGEYEILGEMDRAEGGGIVYFARDLASGRIVALRLRKEAPAPEEAGESYSLGVTQVMKPLVASMGAAYAPPPAGVHAPPATDALAPAAPAPAAADAQPLLGRPTAARPTPQEVLIPAEEAPADEQLPPRPPRKAPTWVAGAAAGVVVGVIALVLYVRSRTVAPDGTEARLLPAPAGAGAPASSAARLVDSARIQIAAGLPRGAKVTVNGAPAPRDTIALPPGTYELAVTAPGYASVREQLRVGAGQLVLWAPTMAPTRAPERHESVRRPRRAPVRVAAADSAPAPAAAPTCASAYDAKDWSAAAALCQRDAQAGNIAAQRDLAALYDRGLGVTRDPALASTWYRRAADAGDRDAAYELGLMYDSGRGVPQDARQAAAWYGKAALLGDPAAQFHLAKAYENGAGVARNTGEAVTWYTKAAQAGSAAAQNYLGWLYGNGKGVVRDDGEALRWFRLAAAQGDPQAEFNVGFMYANGRGVSRDDDQAVLWFRKSAKQGYDDAIEALKERGITP